MSALKDLGRRVVARAGLEPLRELGLRVSEIEDAVAENDRLDEVLERQVGELERVVADVAQRRLMAGQRPDPHV